MTRFGVHKTIPVAVPRSTTVPELGDCKTKSALFTKTVPAG